MPAARQRGWKSGSGGVASCSKRMSMSQFSTRLASACSLHVSACVCNSTHDFGAFIPRAVLDYQLPTHVNNSIQPGS